MKGRSDLGVLLFCIVFGVLIIIGEPARSIALDGTLFLGTSVVTLGIVRLLRQVPKVGMSTRLWVKIVSTCAVACWIISSVLMFIYNKPKYGAIYGYGACIVLFGSLALLRGRAVR